MTESTENRGAARCAAHRRPADVTTHIQGIPCGIAVTHYQKATHGSDVEPPEPAEFEYVVLDRHGYRARWLEDKMTEKDHLDVLGLLHQEDRNCG